MKEQLIEAWEINNRMNLLFFKHVGAKGMAQTLSKRGGRTVYQQWVHAQQVRLHWLEIIAKDIKVDNSSLSPDEPYDQKKLVESFQRSAKAVTDLIQRSWDEGGKLKGYKTGLIPFVSYLIAHEAHHRGHALLNLKQSGIKIPKELSWGLWDWHK